MRAYQQIKKEAARYINRDLAFGSLKHYVKPMRVMLGDDMRFWVVTPANAARLEHMGLEYAV